MENKRADCIYNEQGQCEKNLGHRANGNDCTFAEPQHTGHKQTKYAGGIIIDVGSLDCLACKEENKTATERQVERDKYTFENREVLHCARCGVLMGYVYESDLEGNRFYCLVCGKK